MEGEARMQVIIIKHLLYERRVEVIFRRPGMLHFDLKAIFAHRIDEAAMLAKPCADMPRLLRFLGVFAPITMLVSPGGICFLRSSVTVALCVIKHFTSCFIDDQISPLAVRPTHLAGRNVCLCHQSFTQRLLQVFFQAKSSKIFPTPV